MKYQYILRLFPLLLVSISAMAVRLAYNITVALYLSAAGSLLYPLPSAERTTRQIDNLKRCIAECSSTHTSQWLATPELVYHLGHCYGTCKDSAMARGEKMSTDCSLDHCT